MNETTHKTPIIKHTHSKSLEEINGTVEIPKTKNFWRNLLAFSGPGA